MEISKRDRELNELLKNSLAGKHSQDLSAKDTFFQNLNYVMFNSNDSLISIGKLRKNTSSLS